MNASVLKGLVRLIAHEANTLNPLALVISCPPQARCVWFFCVWGKRRVGTRYARLTSLQTKEVDGKGCAVGRTKVSLAQITQAVIPGLKTHRTGGECRRPKELLSAFTHPVDKDSGIPCGGQLYFPMPDIVHRVYSSRIARWRGQAGACAKFDWSDAIWHRLPAR